MAVAGCRRRFFPVLPCAVMPERSSSAGVCSVPADATTIPALVAEHIFRVCKKSNRVSGNF